MNSTQQGYDDPFNEIVAEHTEFAHNVARRILRNEHDVEEAVQEAFLSAYRAFPNFKGESKVTTWLYRIVVNACLIKMRYNKSRSRHIVQPSSYEREPIYPHAVADDMFSDPEKLALNSELGELLKKHLEALTSEVRSAVVLRDVHGYSTSEASEILDISVPALKSRLHRGRTLLKESLGDYEQLKAA